MKQCKRILTLLLLFAMLGPGKANAQCTNANVNWDNLDYLISTGSYSPWVTAAMEQTQRFAIGVNAVRIATTSLTISGENTSHTGEGGSFGTGADVQYSGNGTITITFDNEVTNARFSLYDVDRSCQTQVTATNTLGTGLNVTLSPAFGLWSGSVFTPTPLTTTSTSVGLNPRVNASGTSVNNSTNTATVNVSVAGPVRSITVTISSNNTDPTFWLSDIQACVVGGFATNYYNVSQPFTGQPSWVLAVHDLNTVYMVNPANGRAVSIFSDNDPRVREINSISYDPHKRIIYYSVDGLERCTPAGNPDSIRHIKKYDVNTETISPFIANVNSSPIGIPTFNYGLESGGAAFYSNSLYMGVEGYNTQAGTKNTNRETIIWRIDFASDSITPVSACQVWAIPVDNGTNNVHDWADFVLKDGILYNQNSSVNAVGGSGRGLYYHVNMQTNLITTTVNPNASADRPGQFSQSWNGTLYWVRDEIGVYNGTNASTVTGKQTIAAAPRSVTWVGPSGDGGEAFRPKADFGDAPASYDPVALSPALHERDTALRIGNYGWEWAKRTDPDAYGDTDEDGIAAMPLLSTSGTGYMVRVNVWNNTGLNATLIAWLDYNDNGVFDSGEAITPITVSTMPSMQSILLNWPSTPNSFSVGDFTFLRIRLTSFANSMTINNPTGYFSDGEVEDYKVFVGEYPLDVRMLSFNVKALNNKTAQLSWTTTSEDGFSGFEVERSLDGVKWTTIGVVKAKGGSRTGINDYVFTDLQPYRGQTFYRLKLINENSQFQFSEIRQVVFKEFVEQFKISPNPARNSTALTLNANSSFNAKITVTDFMGKTVLAENVFVNAGTNTIALNNISQLQNGMYVVQVTGDGVKISGKLIISK